MIPDLSEDELAQVLETASPELVRELKWRLTARENQIPPEDGWTTFIARLGRGAGKRLWIETPILTPSGFKKMGQLREGDKVYDENGKECNITYVSPITTAPSYKLTFSDGAILYADPEHQWVTWTHRERKNAYRRHYRQKIPFIFDNKWAQKPPVTTETILASLRYGKRKDLNHCIPLAKPLQRPEIELPLHPYILGAWLGDGTAKTAEMSNTDQQIRDRFEALGVPTWDRNQVADKCPRYMFGNREINGRREYSCSRILRQLGVLKNKHIPKIYLEASEKQRMELLRGLMDTDGTFEKGNSRVSFTTTCEQLAEEVFDLVLSLGMKPTIKEKQAKLDSVLKRKAYIVAFSALDQVFYIERKAERIRQNASQAARNMHRMIVSIEQAPALPMCCISVDSPNNLYLAGRNLIPTHNTRLASEWVRKKIEIDGCKSGLIVGSTTAKVVDVMVEGPSGILACCPDAIYKSNKAQVVWPNGSRVYIQTAEKKEGARGYSVEFVWADEFCEWKYERETWGNVIATVREKGTDGQSTSQKLITTTPKRTTLLREIEEKEGTIVVTGSTYDNRDNLTQEYLDELEMTWGGTSLYRQEVLGEYLEQVEGAIWQEEWIKHGPLPGFDFDKVVIGVDPSVSVSRTSDETGIVVVARLADEYFVLDDFSGKLTIDQWASRCIEQAEKYGCEVIVEKNQGGDLLKKVITDKSPYTRVKLIHAITSKEDRLGSAAIYYERGQVTHVLREDENGNILEKELNKFKLLETQMVSWVPPSPGNPQKESPDRADALSHAVRYLAGKKTGINHIAKAKTKTINLIKNRRGTNDPFTTFSGFN